MRPDGSRSAGGRQPNASPPDAVFGSPGVQAARRLFEAACALRRVLEDEGGGSIRAALVVRDHALAGVMEKAESIARDPEAVGWLRKVAVIDSETLGRAGRLRDEIEGVLAEIAVARGALARVMHEAAPRLVERTA